MSRSQQGFTLIELLVSIALMSIIVGVVGFIYARSQEIYDLTQKRVGTFRDLRIHGDRLTEDLAHLVRDPDPARRLRISRSEYARTVKATYRSDEVSFVTSRRVGGRTREQRVTYRMAATDQPIPYLEREVEDLETGTVQREILLEGAVSFRIRFLAADAGGMSRFFDPGDLTVNGDLFYASGTDGVLDGNRFTTSSGTRFWSADVPGREIWLGRDDILYAYTLQGVEDGPAGEETVLFLERPQPDASAVQYLYYNLPEALEITVRLLPYRQPRILENAADTLSRIIPVGR